MNYTPKEFSEIFEEMLNDSLEQGLISHAEDFQDLIENREDISNYYIMDKSVIANMVASMIYPDMTSVYESAKVIYAEGADLDDIGDNLGIPRPPATYAEAEITFQLSSSEELTSEIIIPEGVKIATDSGIEYTTLKSLYFSQDILISTVQCQAVEPGQDSKIGENELINLVDSLDYDISITSNTVSSGGENEYSDDEYRYFLLNWFKIYLKGSQEAFEYYFANVNGVDGYKLVPNWDGQGTIKIIVDPGSDDQLSNIYDELQGSVTQFSETFYLCPPTDKKIDIYAVVNVDIDQINPYSSTDKEEIKSRILQAITTFFDGGYLVDGEYYPGLLIGEDFIPHKLAVFLDDEISELKNITFKFPEDYILISDEEKGKLNSINIEMI